MLVLRQSTAIDIRLGPFVAFDDGVTPITAAQTISSWDQGEVLKENGAATSAMAGTIAAVTGCGGWYDYTVGTGDVDTVGEVVFVCQDASVFLPVFVRAMVVEEAVYDALYDATATGLFSGVALASAQTTAQNDLDTLTDTDGVILGAAAVDLIWDEVISAAAHNVTNSAARRLRGLSDFGVYEGGAVWYDDVNGTAGTTDFENGTVAVPSNAEADVTTLLASLGLGIIHCAPGSTYTLEAAYSNRVFVGDNWTLQLNGQAIDNCVFVGASVTGTATNTTGEQYFKDCKIGAVNLPTGTHLHSCDLAGDQTLGEAGNYYYDQCRSAVAGSGSISINFGALGNQSLNVRHHSGGWNVANMGNTGTDTASFEGYGQIIWAASCAASTASVRGAWAITDQASGAVTVTYDDVTDKANSLTFTKTGEIDANIQSINGAEVTGDGNTTPWDSGAV